MRKICKDCKTRFDVPISELEDGDPFACPECGLDYTAITDSSNKLVLIETKKLELDEDEDEEDEDFEEDYE